MFKKPVKNCYKYFAPGHLWGNLGQPGQTVSNTPHILPLCPRPLKGSRARGQNWCLGK